MAPCIKSALWATLGIQPQAGCVCVCVCVCVSVFACRANRGATCDDTGALLRLVAVVIARCLSDLCFVFCSIPWLLASSQAFGQPWGYSPKQAYNCVSSPQEMPCCAL